MATMKKGAVSEFQRRAELLEKLYALGNKNEKALLQMQIEKLVFVDGMTIEELRDIAGLQKAVKSHALYEWLCSATETAATEEAENYDTD